MTKGKLNRDCYNEFRLIVVVRGSCKRLLSNFYKMKQDTFSERHVDIVVPDLGVGPAPLRFILWLVPVGAEVIPGERIAEIGTPGIVFQLDAEHQGTLVQNFVRTDDPLQPGQVLGVLHLASDEDAPASSL